MKSLIAICSLVAGICLAQEIQKTPELDPASVARHSAVSRMAAADGIVLLKNEGATLPLAPGLNIHRHPLCGRNFEYFSEDPLVSGVAAAAYVRGVQSCGVGATVKHFAGNNAEYMRNIATDIVGERAMREIYLRGFERVIKKGKPWAVMAAFNGINGTHSSANKGLLQGILRDEWGFDEVVTTDWNTEERLWREVAGGTDVKMDIDAEWGGVAKPGDGEALALKVFDRHRDYLPVAQVRESAKRVCRLAMKSRRFARERAARKGGEAK